MYATYVHRIVARGKKYQILIENTILKRTVALPDTIATTINDPQRLYIDKPWSDERGILVDAGGFGRYPLYVLFYANPIGDAGHGEPLATSAPEETENASVTPAPEPQAAVKIEPRAQKRKATVSSTTRGTTPRAPTKRVATSSAKAPKS